MTRTVGSLVLLSTLAGCPDSVREQIARTLGPSTVDQALRWSHEDVRDTWQALIHVPAALDGEPHPEITVLAEDESGIPFRVVVERPFLDAIEIDGVATRRGPGAWDVEIVRLDEPITAEFVMERDGPVLWIHGSGLFEGPSQARTSFSMEPAAPLREERSPGVVAGHEIVEVTGCTRYEVSYFRDMLRADYCYETSTFGHFVRNGVSEP